jgi:hypothetical protein
MQRSVVAAAMVAQLAILVIMYIPAGILRRAEKKFYRGGGGYERISWSLLPVSLFTLGLLFLSDSFSPLWGELIGEDFVTGLPSSAALTVVFIVDILTLGYLIANTRGSFASPFSPVLFTLPPIAIFLREPFQWVLVYLVLIALIFSLTLGEISSRYAGDDLEAAARRRSYFWVSLLCLILTTWIGYWTRPR